MTTEQVAAEVLAEHAYSWGSARCLCGKSFTFTEHGAHLVSVLAARLDDGLVWGRDGVDGHPCIRVEAYMAAVNGRNGLAAKVRELADEWKRTNVVIGPEYYADELRALLDQPHTGTNP